MENQTNNQAPQQTSPAPSQQPSGPQGAQNKTVMGVFCYLGPLVLIPLLTGAKRDPFIKFHIKQGLVVFSIEVIVSLFGWLIWPLWMLLNLVNLAALALSIIGIINVVNNKEKELPIVGVLARHFPI